MLSCFSYFGYDLPIKIRFSMIRKAGFDGVGLWWGNGFGDDNYRKSPEMARKAGLFVENIHVPSDKAHCLWLDNLEGDAYKECLLGCVEDCANYDIPTVVMHLSNRNELPPINQQGLDRVLYIVEKAERSRINIAFENLCKVQNKYLHFVLAQVDSQQAGFCYDSGHHHCWTPDEDLLTQYGSRLMALHLHDNYGYRRKDLHLLPFEGTINWSSIMKILAKSGYNGAVSLESRNGGYEDVSAEVFLNIAVERAKMLDGFIRHRPSDSKSIFGGHPS